MKLFSKNSNLCDHNSPTLQTDRQTDRRTDRRHAIAIPRFCTKVHRAVKMVNGFRYYRALESVSIASALSIPLLPFTHARSESINADSLNSNFLQLGRRRGGRPQRAVHPMRLHVNTVIHTTLVGLEPATFRSLVDCWSDALPLPVVPPTHLTIDQLRRLIPHTTPLSGR